MSSVHHGILQSARPGQRDSKPVLRARRVLQFKAFIQLLNGLLQVPALGGQRKPQIHPSGVAVGIELNRLFELRNASSTLPASAVALSRLLVSPRISRS